MPDGRHRAGVRAGEGLNKYNWGIPDSEGRGTGYFYLSYYDRNISGPESMTFGVDLIQAGGEMISTDNFSIKLYVAAGSEAKQEQN